MSRRSDYLESPHASCAVRWACWARYRLFRLSTSRYRCRLAWPSSRQARRRWENYRNCQRFRIPYGPSVSPQLKLTIFSLEPPLLNFFRGADMPELAIQQHVVSDLDASAGNQRGGERQVLHQ